MLLCAYLIVERLKGSKGFYHDYFEVVKLSVVEDYFKWNRNEIESIEHPRIIEEMKGNKEKTEKLFMAMLTIIRTNEDLFDQNIKNNEYGELFLWAYEFVTTRGFSL